MERYQRKESESTIDYLLRLSEIKIEEKPDDLEWNDIVKYCGFNCHYDSLRKAIQPSEYGGYAIYKYFKDKLINENFSDDKILKEYEIKRIEFEKEKQKFFDQRVSYKKAIRDDTRLDEVYDIIQETIQSGNLPKIEFNYKTIEHTDNDLLVSLNDLHFGANIKNAWNTYNSDICKERLNDYFNEILRIKELHNSENCYVSANGDLINGNIHLSVLVSNKENIIEQIMGVSELVAQFLSELSKHFNNVVFIVVAGNHSRIGSNKDNSLKNERLDDLIPWYVKARLQNINNVFVNENLDNTMSLVDIRGKKYLNIHGDYDSGKSAVQSVCLMSGQNIYAVCCGHLHHNSIDYIDKIKVIMAGSFLGMDDFCITKRIVGIPQQLVCVCDDNGVKCSYDISFD